MAFGRPLTSNSSTMPRPRHARVCKRHYTPWPTFTRLTSPPSFAIFDWRRFKTSLFQSGRSKERCRTRLHVACLAEASQDSLHSPHHNYGCEVSALTSKRLTHEHARLRLMLQGKIIGQTHAVRRMAFLPKTTPHLGFVANYC